MKKEVRVLLEKEIKDYRISIIKLVIPIILSLLIIFLCIFNFINLIFLFLIIPMGFIIKLKKDNFQLCRFMLFFTRYLIDDEFSKKFK